MDNVTITERPVRSWQPLIVLLCTLLIAGIAAYIFWDMNRQAPMDDVVTTEDSVTVEEDAGPALYFSATLRGGTTTLTYQYSIESGEWRPVVDFPGHSEYSPTSAQAGLVTMVNLDVPADQQTVENAFLPAYLDLVTGDFTYLNTPAGVDERHYRIAPTDEPTFAYMQRTDAGSDPQAITSWQTVIYQPTTGESTVIDGAVYPQWVSATEMLIMREESLFVYDVTTGQEQFIDLFYTNFNLTSQYLLGPVVASGTQKLLLTALEEQQYGLLQSVPNDEFPGVPAFDLELLRQDAAGVIYNPVPSPLRTQFAALRQVTDQESGAAEVWMEIADLNTLETEVIIPLNIYEPNSVQLLGWTNTQ